MSRQITNNPAASRRYVRRLRHGATAVELALVLLLFLTLVLGMLDLGIAVFRNHLLAEAARQGARQVIVHGKLADKLGSWGPGTLTLTGTDSHPLVSDPNTGIRRLLTGIDPSQVNITVEWLGGNDPQAENRVRVRVTTTYYPMVFIFGNTHFDLSGSSTMYIAH